MWGFLYGWTSFTVIQTGTIAAVGVAFAKFLGVFAPAWGTGEAAVLYEGGRFAGIPLNLPYLDKPLMLFEVAASQSRPANLSASGRFSC